MNEKLTYLPGLNGIRAIAAMIVLVFHIDLFMPTFGLKGLGFYNSNMASFAVFLFFVLSGFLITYLLLREKAEYQTIALKKFYIRRILRIWPVYYIVLIAGVFLCISQGALNEKSAFTLYGLFLSNFAFAYKLGFVTIMPLWSVGVEEQFYLVWPLVLKKSNHVLRLLLVFLVAYLSLRFFLRFDYGFWYSLFKVLPFDCMAIGGIAAVLLREKSGLLKIIYHPAAQLFSWIFLLVSIFYKPVHLSLLLDRDIHSVVYAVLILNVCSNQNNLVSLENKVLDFLGKISYGLYAYHVTVLFILANYILPKGVGYVTVYTMVIAGTLLVAYLSYQFIEIKLQRTRGRYSVIKSTR